MSNSNADNSLRMGGDICLDKSIGGDGSNQDTVIVDGYSDMQLDLTSNLVSGVTASHSEAHAVAHTGAMRLHPEIELLRSFVPLNILSDDHLNTIAISSELELAMPGQVVADAELLQRSQVFLVSGCLALSLGDGRQINVYGGSSSSHLSIGDNYPQAVAVTAIEDCQLFIVDRNKLDAMLCWDQVAKTLAVEFSADRQFDEDAGWMNTLLCSNLFHKIPPYNVKQIFDRFEPRVVQSGETIVRQGEQGDLCFIIKEGYATVSQCDVEAAKLSNQDKTSEQIPPVIVAQLGPGRCFGEDALLNKTTRNATVTMDSNGVLMCLRKRDFLALMAEPEVASLSAGQAEKQIAGGARWLDVRSQQEFDNEHKSEAFHLPMHLMSLKSRLMTKDVEYIAYCSTGRRASTVAYLLSQQGFKVQALAP